MPTAIRVSFVVMAVLFAVVGLPWFVAPGHWAERFPWSVTPFMAMTIGAWCLGNAWVAALVAGLRRWDLARALVVYLFAFAAGQLGVLAWFADKVVTDQALTWPYLAALLVTLLGSAWALVESLGVGRASPDDDGTVPRWARWFITFFTAFVVFLAAVALVAPDRGLDGSIFPEPMTPFTLRAFGAFYLALGIGALALQPLRTVRPALWYGVAGMGLVVPITAAIPVYWEVFAIGDRPAQVLYVAAYVLVLVVTTTGLITRRHQLLPPPTPT